MEISGCPLSNYQSYRGLFDSFRKRTPFSKVSAPLPTPICNSSVPSNGSRSSVSLTGEHNCSVNGEFGLPVSDVSGLQNRRLLSPRFQFKTLKHLSFSKEVQAFEPPKSPIVSSKWGLHGKNRPLTSLLPRSRVTSPPPIPVFRLPGKSFPMDMPPVWSRDSPTSIRATDKLGGFSASRQRNSHSGVLRRLSSGKSKSSNSVVSHSGNCRPSIFFGLANQFRKIPTCSQPVSRVPGHCLEHSISTSISTREKGVNDFESTVFPTSKTCVVAKVGSVPDRYPKLRSFCNSFRSSPPQEDSDSLSSFASFEASSISSYPSSGLHRNSVVASEPVRVVPSTSPIAPGVHVNGCLKRSVGSRSVRKSLPGNVVPCSTVLAYKSKRVICCSCSNLRKFGYSDKLYGNFTNGQQDSLSLHSKTGRLTINYPSAGNRGALQSDVLPELSHSSIFHSGKTEHLSRLSLSAPQSSGLAPKLLSYPEGLHAVGNPTNRSLCYKSVESCEQLCDSGCSRSPCNVQGRVLQALDVQAGVGLSSPSLAASGSSSPKFGVGQIHSGCSSLGKGILESGSQIQSMRSPNCNIESQKSPVGFNDQSSPSSGGRHNLGDLVNTGWGHQTKGWSDQDMKLLSEAWRPSTRKTYQRPWSRWLSWCSSMNIDSHNPLPQHLAQFLAHLHHSVGLALRSILLHKSVVATLSNPDNSSTLSSHPIVLKIIKGISASRLIHPSRSTWDISTLLNWIRDHRPSSQSFFEVSRHLAILFLLASGRRVHDLTLLQLDSTHFQASDDFIILWPCFGSKTDSNSFQQSGWRFTMAPAEDHLWCIPYWMRIFHTLRAKRIGSTLIPSLFISTYGRVRQASRALIAGWVSTALKAANIPFPPGSFRAAVNSSLARNNLPLDVIMMRGNWRSADTFLRYYYKPLAPDTAEMPRNNPVSIGFSPIS